MDADLNLFWFGPFEAFTPVRLNDTLFSTLVPCSSVAVGLDAV